MLPTTWMSLEMDVFFCFQSLQARTQLDDTLSIGPRALLMSVGYRSRAKQTLGGMEMLLSYSPLGCGLLPAPSEPGSIFSVNPDCGGHLSYWTEKRLSGQERK